MKHFRFFDIFTVVCFYPLTGALPMDPETMLKALTITAILAVMEVSLS